MGARNLRDYLVSGLVGLAGVGLSGCIHFDYFPSGGVYHETREECETNGGEWTMINRGQEFGCVDYVEGCNFRTSDYGVDCTDSLECEGKCVAEFRSNSDFGSCSEFRDVYGCWEIFENSERRLDCPDVLCE